MPTPWLTDAELRDATHRKTARAHGRALAAIGVPFKRRPDGTLLVGREAMVCALSGNPVQPAPVLDRRLRL